MLVRDGGMGLSEPLYRGFCKVMIQAVAILLSQYFVSRKREKEPQSTRVSPR